MDSSDIESIKQIAPKFSVLNELFKLLIGCRYDSDIDRMRSGRTKALYLPLLQDAQDLRLCGQWHLSNFVEKDRPAACRRKYAAARDPTSLLSLLRETSKPFVY